MALFDKVVLSTAYMPPVEYFALIKEAEKVFIEGCEYYQKQSYRTRTKIYATDGTGSLQIPILKGVSHKQPIRDIKIDYSKPWLIQHKRAIVSAYNSSPFFEYYQDDIFSVLDKKEEFLFDLNLKLIETFMDLIGLPNNIVITEEFVKDYESGDYRSIIHPKKDNTILAELKKEKTYYQVFSHKFGFIKNLSILDLLCAEGPDSFSYL